jgi:hypothetical protein
VGCFRVPQDFAFLFPTSVFLPLPYSSHTRVPPTYSLCFSCTRAPLTPRVPLTPVFLLQLQGGGGGGGGWEGGSKGARRGGALRTSTRPTLSLLLQPTSSLILVSIHSQDSSYSDLGRVLVRNDPPARRTPARHSGDDGAYGRGPTRRPLVCSTACQNPTTQL